MAITKKLVDQMHGSLDVESEPARVRPSSCGCRCRWTPRPTLWPRSNPPSRRTRRPLRGCDLLLAEDNELNSEIAVTLLEAEAPR